MPLGLLVTEQSSGSLVFWCMALNTGLSVYRVQGTFPYRHGSLPLGSPVGLQMGQLPIR